MKSFLLPAKRHRKERIRAAKQHIAGIRAVGLMILILGMNRCEVDVYSNRGVERAQI